MPDYKRGLFWFRNDLRLADNPALNSICKECDEVVFLYVLDKKLLLQTKFGTTWLGNARWQFIQECLNDLNKQLSLNQQKIIFKVGEPSKVISKLLQDFKINHVGETLHSGFYET